METWDLTDASLYSLMVRAAKPYAMRYPLYGAQGSEGNLIENDSEGAPRYVEGYVNDIGKSLFETIDKETITDWRDNYDVTEQYPAILPSLGFYNIVNGTMGIGVGIASSICQHNLIEVNNALIKLLWNPEIDFSEIYCAPDFCTGAELVNEEEVKESLKKGIGKAAKLRATINYEPKTNQLIVSEIPYSVYTNTICRQLEQLIESNESCGIDSFIDVTGIEPNIQVNLSKKANPEAVKRLLYKETSLQSYYGINMVMLENGRFPRLFTWKEALQAHLDHEKKVLRRAYEFDLRKLKARLHIVLGLIIALARVDEVVELIKSSKNSNEAALKLQQAFSLSELQAKAILEIRLSRLVNMERIKLEQEKNELESKIGEIELILSDQNLLYKKIEENLRRVAETYGDARRTQISNYSSVENEDELIVEEKETISFSNYGRFYHVKELKSGKTPIKLSKGEFIVDSVYCSNKDSILLITNQGRSFLQRHLEPEEIKFNENEQIQYVLPLSKLSDYKYLAIATRKGLIKKTKLEDIIPSNKGGLLSIKLKEDDSVTSVFLLKGNDQIYVLTKDGRGIQFSEEEINSTGRQSMGVKSIYLEQANEVVSAGVLFESLILVSKFGQGKVVSKSDLSNVSRGAKGRYVLKFDENDYLVSSATYSGTLIVSTNKSVVHVKAADLETNRKKGKSFFSLGKNEEVVRILNN